MPKRSTFKNQSGRNRLWPSKDRARERAGTGPGAVRASNRERVKAAANEAFYASTPATAADIAHMVEMQRRAESQMLRGRRR